MCSHLPLRCFVRGRGGLPAAADPPSRPDQPYVPDRVGDLCPPAWLEVGQQVELAPVVGPMTAAAGRDYTQGVPASAERARDQVRRVDSVIAPAGDMHVRRATAATSRPQEA
jgi:hypothetical protein